MTTRIAASADGEYASLSVGSTEAFRFGGDTSGQLVGFRNKIINGGFEIWQRGTTQVISGYGSADRWSSNNLGTTKTTSQQAFVLGQVDVPGNPKYYSRTVVSSVAGAGNHQVLIQGIEGVPQFSNKKVTISFYAKADSPKNIGLELAQIFGSGGSPSSPVFGIGAQLVPLTASWQKFSRTISVPSLSGKTLGTSGDYLGLQFWMDAGSDFNSRSASLGHQSGTFDIANVQLEEGSIATPFEQRPIGLELSLCQRYCAVIYAGQLQGGGLGNAGNVFNYIYTYPVQLRTAPVYTGGGFSNVNISAQSLSYTNGVYLVLSNTVGATGPYTFSNTANYIASAEL